VKVKKSKCTVVCSTVEIPLRNLTDDKKQEITLLLQKQKERINTHINPDYLYPVHCPWCGIHLKYVIDFDKCCKEGQYSSKENWEIAQNLYFINFNNIFSTIWD
jgi:hypothetical protein